MRLVAWRVARIARRAEEVARREIRRIERCDCVYRRMPGLSKQVLSAFGLACTGPNREVQHLRA
jgi:hypothetical protein